MSSTPAETPPAPSVLLALSGGVDSSASLVLLCREKAAGRLARLEAAYIKTWMHEKDPISDCPWQQDIADATAVCEKLGVPFRVVNLIGEYETHVVKMLVDGYARGITPNPDIACNRFIKFGAFLDFALKEGFTHVATGHYARRKENSLLEGLDPNKDQSYFLAQLTPAQLSHALFPIGGLLKPEVRALAKEAGLPNFGKKDSQGICFLGKVKINDFLRRYLPDSPGPIVNSHGVTLGAHKGLHHYTLGQRKGIGIPSNADGEHYVVVAKDFAANTLRVAFDHPTTEGLYQTVMKLHHLHWLGENQKSKFFSSDNRLLNPNGVAQNSPGLRCSLPGANISSSRVEGFTLLARPRYRDPKVPATLEITDETAGEGILTFNIPQRALASGQLVAFYLDDELVGSGVYL